MFSFPRILPHMFLILRGRTLFILTNATSYTRFLITRLSRNSLLRTAAPFFEHVQLVGDPRPKTRWRVYIHGLRKSWRTWKWRKMSGLSCRTCCHWDPDPDRRHKVNGWMEFTYCTLHFGHCMIFSPCKMICFVRYLSGGRTATVSSVDNHHPYACWCSWSTNMFYPPNGKSQKCLSGVF